MSCDGSWKTMSELKFRTRGFKIICDGICDFSGDALCSRSGASERHKLGNMDSAGMGSLFV